MKFKSENYFYKLYLTIGLGLALCLFAPALSAAPPARRMVLETGTHTARVNDVASDARGRRLLTCGDDRTARLWDAQSGAALGVFRLPGDHTEKNSGKLHACALSPDGSLAALGGEVGYENGKYRVYIIDTDNGAVVHAIYGFNNYARALAFSPDGRYLSVGLLGHSGTKIFDTRRWKIYEHFYGGYNAKSVSFDRSGRLFFVSHVLAAQSTNDLQSVMLTDGSAVAGGNFHFYDGAFSPDGDRAVVSFSDARKLLILGGDTLDTELVLDMTGVEQEAGLSSVAYGPDAVYAAGRHRRTDGEKTQFLIRRYVVGDAGQDADVTYTDLAAGENMILALEALAGGGVAYVSTGAEVGVLDARGRRVFQSTGATLDPRMEAVHDFRLSADALAVRFAFRDRSTNARVVRLLRLADTPRLTVGAAADQELPDFITPRQESKALRVSQWEESDSPKVNGRVLDFTSGKTWSLAIDPNDAFALLGTSWGVYRVDRRAKLVWEIPTPAPALALNVSRDGAVFVAAYDDGTIRWYATEDGRELCAFYLHPDGKRWVLWTPEGYYAGPGEDLLHVQEDQGPARSPRMIPAADLKEYKRPEIFAPLVRTREVREVQK